ncbi:MAG TPA: hypothetical protein VM347_37290 [Nonomuraea sp.]|nr:hypothetical protein [Nonomuraea sp.]
MIAAAALLVTVAGVALLAGTRPAEHSAQPNVDAPTTVTSTALAVSAEPASSQPGGTITTETGRFELGASNDRVVLGDWDCDGEETPALLVMATGEVFAFASWADDSRTVEGRLVRTIRDAADVAATQGDADGCTELEVRRFDGSTVTLEVPS